MNRPFWFCCVRVWTVVAVSTLTFAPLVSAKTTPPELATYWIFLTTGKSTKGIARAEVEKMQAAHLANFGRQYKAGRLFLAGPMADPQKKKRGIVVVTAADANALPELFETDPYVKQGIMTIDAIKMEIVVGKFQKDFDANSLAEYRLVLLEKSTVDGAEIDATVQKSNLEYCKSINDAQRLCFAGWLSETKLGRRGILIFRKLDDARLKSLVDELPAVKSRVWKATSFPLFMSDGVVK